MPLPTQVEVLVVGAGPTGLATAIALDKLGLQVVIVDSSSINQNGSRAAVVHSHTLEILHTIGMAQPLIENGTRCDRILYRGTTNPVLEFDFAQLRDATEFPFSVLISQCEVERIFRERLASKNIHILRNKAVIGLRQSEDSTAVDVTFEDESVVKTQYVIGADGSRSTIRRLMGIEFKDPYTGVAYDDDTAPTPSFHIVLADVYLDDPLPESIPRTSLSIQLDQFFLLIPLLEKADPAAKPTIFWRIALEPSAGGPKPPRNPSLDYLQQLIDERNPWDTKITITSVATSSSYRIRVAVASTYFQKVGNGNILLAGDAAHVHSPVGGQGMNLGICDAVAVAHAVRSHMDAKDPEQRDDVFQDYSNSRRKVAFRVVGLASSLTGLLGGRLGWRRTFRDFALRALSCLPFFRRFVAWRVSGLVNRDH